MLSLYGISRNKTLVRLLPHSISNYNPRIIIKVSTKLDFDCSLVHFLAGENLRILNACYAKATIQSITKIV